MQLGYIAQWLERLTADQQVPGSNPGVPSWEPAFGDSRRRSWQANVRRTRRHQGRAPCQRGIVFLVFETNGARECLRWHGRTTQSRLGDKDGNIARGSLFHRCSCCWLLGWVGGGSMKLLVEGFRGGLALVACKESWIPSGTWEPEASDREQNGASMGKAICGLCWLLLLSGEQKDSARCLWLQVFIETRKG